MIDCLPHFEGERQSHRHAGKCFAVKGLSVKQLTISIVLVRESIFGTEEED